MRYLIVSDIHSNLEALQAVRATTVGAYDKIVCCGDLVGYGADPNAVVDWVRSSGATVVRGNHDKACCGITEPEDFNDLAKASAHWTRAQLTPESLTYLIELPEGPVEIGNKFSIFHGSPRDEDEYVHDTSAATRIFKYLRRPVSFFGHTHLQGGFTLLGSSIGDVPLKLVNASSKTGRMAREVLALKPNTTSLLNPGSVGQPRDRDWRAAFAIYDTNEDLNGTVEFGRAAYDVETAMKKIRQAGLPDFHASRLALGR